MLDEGQTSGLWRVLEHVSMLYYTAVVLVSVSSVIISQRFHSGSRRFETSGSQPSKASDQTHDVSLYFTSHSVMLRPAVVTPSLVSRTDVTHLPRRSSEFYTDSTEWRQIGRERSQICRRVRESERISFIK